MPVPLTPPEWVQDAVFYQIFPDRFRNGDRGNDPSNVYPWGLLPTSRTFFGGDLAGVIEKFPYLLDMGINALYFNPIFTSSSTHRYNTYDYFQVDPRLGTIETFRQLIQVAHQHGIRVILDAVLNHCGRGLFQFQDLLENGPQSPYLDWFHVKGFPLHAYDEHQPPNYLCWWNLPSLPKFNTQTAAVRRFLLSVARYWLEQGIDGWRLDVPNEIDDDAFWREFRAVVKATNPEAYIVGEIWTDGQRWLQGDQFDGISSYELRTILLDWLVEGKFKSTAACNRLQPLLDKYPRAIVHSQLTVLGSHDTARLMTVAKGNVETVKLLWLFLLTWPGAPCIYYGDEVGMVGGSDPDCRRCFPWEASSWNMELRRYIQQLVLLRKSLPALRRGETRILLAHPRRNLYAHGRGHGQDAVIMAMNACEDIRCIVDIPLAGMEIPAGTEMRDLFSGERYRVRNSRLEAVSLPPRSGAVLVVAQ